ncbi:FIMAH domain-containing protein [Paenibacillus lemnae]|uniref:PQQ-binding-like beta-propeller repeat protein n=1 Tax=Paenibacillus lemnae TaxID=1330551 RepID=A0A848M882_PAELE|nr:PQQ-binding-like beta-propeller repeat protein [Paenibacillus lemnae]NMO96421.1 PQQ-binding-like beta-propeller repeat protein [Paenibacillus lemnae]
MNVTHSKLPAKKGLRLHSLCIALCVSLLSAVLFPGNASAAIGKTYSEPIDLGSPMQSVAIYDGAFGVQDGREVMYTTVSGKPAIFHVIDLKSKEVLGTHPLTGSESSWTHITTPDGTVYIGGNGTLYSYSPVTKELKNLGGIGEQVVYGLSHDEQGRVYFGSYPNAKAGRYDPLTGEMKDYGIVGTGQSYSRSTAYYDGYLYVGIGIEGSIVKMNVETGAKETIALPSYGGAVDIGMVNQLDVAGKYLVAGINKGNSALVFYDLEQQQWSETYHLNNKGIRLSYGPEGSNTIYFVQNNHLMEVDLDTLEAVDTGVVYGTFLRNTAWVEFPNDPDLPGVSLATVQFGGSVAYMNLETKKVKLIPYPVQGNPIPIQTMENGPDGRLFISGYPGGTGSAYSIDDNAFETFPMGQAEGMTALNGKMYMGVYPGADIFEYNAEDPTQRRSLFKITGQDRPFIMRAAEGKLFIGTIPDYGKLGGSLTIYDPADGSSYTEYKNVINNQAISGIAVKDGKVYGSTTVAGGLGINPSEPAAKMFIWDIATGEVEKEWVPSIEGAASAPQIISGTSFGPDGLLWAAFDGTVFAVDPATGQVVKSKTIYEDVENYGRWRPVYLRWSDDGLMYLTLAGQVTVVDPATMEHRTLAESQHVNLGHDGNIYFTNDTQLMKIEVSDAAAEPDTVQALMDDIESWKAQGDISHPVSKQIGNALKQAQRKQQQGKQVQAVKHLKDALKHLDRAKSGQISEEARADIKQRIGIFVNVWS